MINTITAKAGIFGISQRINLNWGAMKTSYTIFFKLIAQGLIFFIIPGNPALAQAQGVDSYALFLYNFGKFSNSNFEGEQFTFTIIGDAGVANDLKQISKNKKIKGKPIHVWECDALDEIGTPQILFVPASQSGLLPKILDRTRGKPVKIITEKSGKGPGEQHHSNSPEAAFI